MLLNDTWIISHLSSIYGDFCNLQLHEKHRYICFMVKNRHIKIVTETVRLFKELRLEKGLSHEALAKKAGVTRSAISHIESGKRNPSLLVALNISYALGVELSDLLEKIETSL